MTDLGGLLAGSDRKANGCASCHRRKLVKDTVGKMKGNLAAIVKSEGGHSTLD